MEPQFSFASIAGAETTGQIAPDTSQVTVPPVSDVPSTAFQPEVPVIAPQQEASYENINAYPESISCSSSGDPSKAVFDIVITVSWQCPASGEYKNAKILKSVAFDKICLVDQSNNQQVTVVEATQKKADNSKMLRTMRELAGVPGKDNFV